MKSAAFALLIAFCLPAVAFSQSTDPKIVEAAKKEGEIIWYTSMTYDQSQVLMQAFQTKYGIKAVLIRLGGGAVMNRVLTETRAGMFGYDVVGGRGEMISIFRGGARPRPTFAPNARSTPISSDKQGWWYAHYVISPHNTRA
jgi:iron(III) transport system substrate-binding protein